MKPATLLHHLVSHRSEVAPDAIALRHKQQVMTYAELHQSVKEFSDALLACGAVRSARVGIYLSKCFEYVIAAFGSAMAGCVFVPINPALKASQLKHILNDCNVEVLITSPERYLSIESTLNECPDLRTVVFKQGMTVSSQTEPAYMLRQWDEFIPAPASTEAVNIIDQDIAAIFYTSGSTGLPKGVVVSHRNLVSGAASVAEYLQQRADDVLIAALPFSFDAGFSQLTTAFTAGATVVLYEYTTAKEALKVIAAEGVTGMTAVPPLWIQLIEHPWSEAIAESLRYFANTGGAMPRSVLDVLQKKAPKARPYLMYGLTEAFRSTYLDPEQVSARPNSIGKAIPNQEIMVLRPDLTPCAPGEHGELVHRGSTVSLGYWNAPELTAKRFRQIPVAGGCVSNEMAVFSGDLVYRDDEGYLYFVGRSDELIKSSGYRISPTEVEEAAYSSHLVHEAAVFGVPDERLGQKVVLVVHTSSDDFDERALIAHMSKTLANYMLPKTIMVETDSLPRNSNNKIDRNLLRNTLLENNTEVVDQ
ncbi:acyl-CoA ligase (AMP-forming), exosortase A system-associated [Gynuella sp.]|uniref:acyl-CoA ligase (AMP-forming), exosortase A system-associated n=1 Tax=Gynuella sp. TaxID=2969146 RepID=UPI003D095FDB